MSGGELLGIAFRRCGTLNCLGGASCHAGAQPKLGLDLSTVSLAYKNLVGVDASQCSVSKDRVRAGDIASSYLINKLTGQGMCSGSVMPKAGGELTSAQIDVIRAWIGAGAANN